MTAPFPATCAIQAQPQQVVILDALSPLAARDEIVRRLLSPLARLDYDRYVAEHRARVPEQSIDPSQERYDVYMPPSVVDAQDGAGLIVFVPPISEFTVPRSWRVLLARHRLILISARRSGNDQNTIERRIPLALHGYDYAIRHYRIDPQRVYVAGFSGGSRVAQIVAFAYADVFRGALLFSGSDPFGDGTAPPPPRELMRLAQQRLRIVQSTGEADEANLEIAARARRSWERLCVDHIVVIAQQRLGHELPDAAGFSRALSAMDEPSKIGTDDVQCNAQLEQRIASELADIDGLLQAGRREKARTKLVDLDARYGWLAAPGSLQSMARLSTLSGMGEVRN